MATKPIKLPLTYKKVPGDGDIKVLNFALSLEQIEADLYAQAVLRLTTGGTSAAGTVIPGLGFTLADPDVAKISEFALVEVQHRDFLTAALGAAAIKPFVYRFGIESMTRQQVVELVLSAEMNGVGAYLGGGIHQVGAYLAIAAAILGTEARHTSVISEVANELFDEGLAVAPLAFQNGGRDTPKTPDQALAAVAPFVFAA